MFNRFRVFPLLIFASVLMLSLKVGVIWQDVQEVATEAAKPRTLIAANTARAQEDAPPPVGAAPPLPEPGEIPDDMVPAETVDEEDPLAVGDLSGMSAGEIRLLHDLASRRRDLEVRERQLQEREALLRGAEQQLVDKQEQLTRIKAEIETLLKSYQGEQEDEARKLVNIYSNMKPKSAAAIFNDMDMDTLLTVLRGMKERNVAPIMAAMNPEKARLVTRELAEIRELPELPQ